MAVGTKVAQSNRLNVLADEIRSAHREIVLTQDIIIKAQKTSIEWSCEAGNKLIEAKSIVPFGEWLAWLKQIDLPERTAQLYMQVAREQTRDPRNVAHFVQNREPLRALIHAMREPEPGPRLVYSRPRPDPAAQRGQPLRNGPDFWPTPSSLIAAARDYVKPHLGPGIIWECASGDGRLGRGISAGVMTDLYPQDGSAPLDFCTDAPPAPDLIAFTNQPFNQIDEFIERGLQLLDDATIRGLVLLLRHDHLTAGGRVEALNRATLEVHCNWRPRWIEDTDGSPRWAYAWVYWGNTPRLPPLYLIEENVNDNTS